MLLLFCGSALRAAVVSFACIGDYGSDYQSTRSVANLVKTWQPHFIITVGDNNYPAGSAKTIDRNVGQFYHAFIHPYKGAYGPGAPNNRFFPCLGNHDWLAPGAEPYLDYFALPGNERYYTFTRGPLQLFCIDSDKSEPDGVATNAIQAEWLKAELARSTAVWKLVYFHHAPYSSGQYHGTWTGETVYFRWPLHEWGVDAVLAGHDHIYERVHTNGLVYFVNGLGGDSRDPLHYPLVPGSQKQFSADFGAMRIDASELGITFRFFTWRGVLVDTYTLLASKRQPSAMRPSLHPAR